MTTTTAVPSSDVSDFVYNVQKLDEIVTGSASTYTDRLGVPRRTATGALAAFGALNPRGAWATATLYQPRDLVLVSGTWYIALDSHTSGATFAGDLTAHWRPEQGVTRLELSDETSASNGTGLVGSVHTPGYDGLPLYEKLRRDVVCLDDFFVAGDADWYNASRRASIYCAQNGTNLNLLGKDYPGARIEVHKTFSIEGNGAGIDYIGFGNTLAAGTGTGTSSVPTAWPATDLDAMADLYPVTMYTPSGSSAAGDSTMSFTSVTNLVAGDRVFIGTNPSSSSSVNNWIPRTFEFARVKSIVGLTVTFWGRLKHAYTTAAAMFRCDGAAVNCTVSNLKIRTVTDAYQHVIRSAFGTLTLRNVEFAGDSAVGGCTFTENIRWENVKVGTAYGPITTARGTEAFEIDGYTWQPRTTAPTPEALAMFFEESFYRGSINAARINGGLVALGSLDMTTGQGKRLFTLSNSLIETADAPGGAQGPFAIASASNLDVVVSHCTLSGTAVTPNASNYPGITGKGLVWWASNAPGDKLKFVACHFKSTTAEPVFPIALSGMQGQVLFDDACTYETALPPLTHYTPRGAWISMSAGLLNGFTVTASNSANFRLSNKDVTLSFRLNLNGAGAGTTFYTMPAGTIPIVEKRFVAATDVAGVWATVRINTSGSVFYVSSNGTPTYIDLQATYPIDV